MTDYRERMEGGEHMSTDTLFRKVKALFVLVLLAALTGAGAALAGVDYTVAFGPTVGTIASAIVAYFVKESLPRIKDYIIAGLGKPDPEA